MSSSLIDGRPRHDDQPYELPAHPGVWRHGKQALFLVGGPPDALRAQAIQIDERTRRTVVGGQCVPIDHLPRGGWQFEQQTEAFVNLLLNEAAEDPKSDEMLSWDFMSMNLLDHIDPHDREIYVLPAFPGVWAHGEYLLCLVDGDPESLSAQLIEADEYTHRTLVSGLRIPVARLPHYDWRFEQHVEEFGNRLLGEAEEDAKSVEMLR